MTDPATATTSAPAPSAPASSAPPPQPTLAPPADEGQITRKRPNQQQLPNGSPVKRWRLSDGSDNANDAATAAEPMDVDPHDQHQDNNAYPSPLEGEEAATPAVQTEGPERGTQLEKVEELTSHTTFICLTDDDRTERTAPHARSSVPPGGDASVDAANAPTLLHCQWNPKDPSVLAASGTGALARIWSLSRATTSDSDSTHDHVSPSNRPLLEPGTSLNTMVSQIAWTSDGLSLALVVESSAQASINIYTSDGVLLQSFDSPAEQVIKLCWNPSNTALLAISPSPDDSGALITVYYASAGISLSYSFPEHDINAAPLDASWTSDSDFLVCGGPMLVSLYCAETSIVEVRRFETKADDNFRSVLFDWRSKLAATSSEKGTLDVRMYNPRTAESELTFAKLWDDVGQHRSISAHQGAITTMEWQPLPPMHPNVDDERLIATGGEDCAILIWNARMPESKARCFLTMDSPIVRLAFTPDGAFIAGATANQVLIWKVGNPIMPRAVWRRSLQPGWLSPKGNFDSDEEGYAEHCLSWDANGQKLAYGSNSTVSFHRHSRWLGKVARVTLTTRCSLR